MVGLSQALDSQVVRWPNACPQCHVGDMVATAQDALWACTCGKCGYEELLNSDDFWWAKQALPKEQAAASEGVGTRRGVQQD